MGLVLDRVIRVVLPILCLLNLDLPLSLFTFLSSFPTHPSSTDNIFLVRLYHSFSSTHVFQIDQFVNYGEALW